MGEGNVVDQSNSVSFALAERGCAPFANAIQSHYRRLLERRREECAGGMSLMVVGEDQTSASRRAQGFADGLPHVQLVFQPQRHGQAKATKPGGSVSQIGLEQPFEFGE